MSLNKLNYPPYLMGTCNLTKRQNLYKTRMNPLLAIPPSSIILPTDESGNLPNSKRAWSRTNHATSLSRQQHCVGIIGGVSLDLTLDFVNKLVKWSSHDNEEEEEDCFPFLLCSDPQLTKQLRISSTGKNNHLQVECGSVAEKLRRKRIFLEQSGASCIVIPCNISHFWYDEISKGCSIPVLHMGESVVKELTEAKLRPLEAGSPLSIGVLATGATLKAGLYQEKLQNKGFEVVLPDKATMEHTIIPAIEALKRRDIEGARNLLRIALQVLLVRGVNRVILASDDMRELLPRNDPLLKRCVDPVDALARSTIKFAKYAERGT